MSKYIFFILFLFLLPPFAMAQFSIKGHVINQNGNDVQLATITVYNTANNIVHEDFTLENGTFEFNLDRGEYTLQITHLGAELYKTNFDVEKNLDFGLLKVDNAQLLDEVIIENKKKIFERKADRLIFNVENSTTALGGDAVDAVNVTPGIRIQNEQIKIIGKNSVSLMIDDKLITLSNNDLLRYLKTIPSENIKSIEVITTPPAKYDAEGNSGILNIKLKKAKKDSWSSTLGSSYTQRTYGTGILTGTFLYNLKKFTSQFSVNSGNASSKNTDNIKTYYPDGLWSDNIPRKIENRYFTINTNLGYQVKDYWKIGIQYSGSFSDINSDENSLTGRFNNSSNAPDSYVRSDLNSQTKPKFNSLNFYNQINLDTISARKIIIDLDYFKHVNSDSRSIEGYEYFANNEIIQDSSFSVLNLNDQNIENYSAKIDTEFPIEFASLSFGGKISKTESDNKLDYYDTQDNQMILVPSQSNKFQYVENNQAIYVSGNKKIGPKWEAQLGLRFEATQTEGYSATYNQKNKNNYTRLFPTAYVKYDLDENSAFIVNYSRRIVRPNYQYLNPFRLYDSPYNYVEGNPFILPSFTDNYELSYSYKGLDTKLFYYHSTKGFEYFSIVDPETNINRTFVDNFLNTKSYGLSISHVYEKIPWWTSINSFYGGYLKSTSDRQATLKQKDGNFTLLTTNNDFVLNKGKTLLLNVSYWYEFSGVMGLYQYTQSSSFSTSLKYSPIPELRLSLSGNDLFKGQLSTYTTFSNGIKQQSRNYYDTRSLRLSVQYTFGSSKLGGIYKENSNDEEKSRLK